MKTVRSITMAAAGLLGLASLGMPALGRAAEDLHCTLHFQLSGWSAFYKRATGGGTVTCDNGQSMKVHIRAEGGGLTFGKSEIDDGHGDFTGVYDIHDVLGHYGGAEAHAGAQASASSQVVTKGNVSLALSGKGRGWNLGIAFGAFILEK